MTSLSYGKLGYALSTIYLAVRLVDLGNSYSVTPFLKDMTVSQQTFSSIIMSFFILPQFPILCISSIFVSHTIFTTTGISWLPIFCIFWCETYRLFLRYLLHAQFKNSHVVVIELSSFCLFLATIWLPYLLWGCPITPHVIIIAHTIDSLIALSALSWLTAKSFKKLPNIPGISHTLKLGKVLGQKSLVYFNRLSRELTSSNILTPLYATLFGFEKIGVFYFIGTATTAYQMIIKNTITYSGNALIATLKYESPDLKKYAFHLITEKLVLFIAIPGIAIAVFYPTIAFYAATDEIRRWILILLGFLALMSIDLMMYIYEQYYLIEDAALKFFYFKVIETCACIGVFFYCSRLPLHKAFYAFITIKIVIASITIVHAFVRWGIFIRIKRIIFPLLLMLGGSVLMKIITTYLYARYIQ